MDANPTLIESNQIGEVQFIHELLPGEFKGHYMYDLRSHRIRTRMHILPYRMYYRMHTTLLSTDLSSKGEGSVLIRKSQISRQQSNPCAFRPVFSLTFDTLSQWGNLTRLSLLHPKPWLLPPRKKTKRPRRLSPSR